MPWSPAGCVAIPSARPRAAAAAAALALAVLAPDAQGQVFLASQEHPPFTIGPLFVRATVTPRLGPVDVEILWSLVIPPDRSTSGLEQDVFLLWPGEIVADPKDGPGDPALARYVAQRGFTVIGEGRTALFSQSLFQVDSNEPPLPIPGGAPFVTFVRQGGALGLTSPVSYVRIPWTPYQVNRARLMDLRFAARGMITARHASWIEKVFCGDRSLITLSFNDVRQRALFPLYFEHRDRLVRLADDPSQLMVNFTDAGHVKIDSVTPPTTRRHLSETLDSTEVVSLFLDRSEGITPQVLTVQFGYFSGWRSWAPVIIPAWPSSSWATWPRPLLRFLGAWTARSLRAHFLIARRPQRAPRPGYRGGDLARDLARIVPGQTTQDEVLRLLGPETEVAERLTTPATADARLPWPPRGAPAPADLRVALPTSRAGTSRTTRSRSRSSARSFATSRRACAARGWQHPIREERGDAPGRGPPGRGDPGLDGPRGMRARARGRTCSSSSSSTRASSDPTTRFPVFSANSRPSIPGSP